MKQFFFIFLYTLFLFFVSCNTDSNRCLKSSGDIKTISSNLEFFNRISINSNFKVILNQKNEYSIELTGGENLLPYIDYEIIGRHLIIDNKNLCNWLRTYEQIEVTINFPYINEININEACKLVSYDTIKIHKINIDNRAGIFDCEIYLLSDTLIFRSHASTGNYKIIGKSKHAYIYNRGNGYFFGRRFNCESMHIVHRSLGNSEISVSRFINVENIEMGKVYNYDCPDNVIEIVERFPRDYVNLGCPF